MAEICDKIQSGFIATLTAQLFVWTRGVGGDTAKDATEIQLCLETNSVDTKHVDEAKNQAASENPYWKRSPETWLNNKGAYQHQSRAS